MHESRYNQYLNENKSYEFDNITPVNYYCYFFFKKRGNEKFFYPLKSKGNF